MPEEVNNGGMEQRGAIDPPVPVPAGRVHRRKDDPVSGPEQKDGLGGGIIAQYARVGIPMMLVIAVIIACTTLINSIVKDGSKSRDNDFELRKQEREAAETRYLESQKQHHEEVKQMLKDGQEERHKAWEKVGEQAANTKTLETKVDRVTDAVRDLITVGKESQHLMNKAIESQGKATEAMTETIKIIREMAKPEKKMEE